LDEPEQLIQEFARSRDTLIQENLAQNSGLRTARRFTDLLDQFIRRLFFHAGFTENLQRDEKNGLAVIALGSYGRRELCLYSDVDLMVVHQGKLSKNLKAIISRALYPLWDAKLEVGHSILTVPECTRLALSDFRVLTSVMDGRLLLGSRSFHRLFEEAFWSRINREKESFLKHFLLNRERRADKFGTEGYFVEPDIKEGLGGLRDIHLISWMAKLYFGCRRLNHIRRFAAFSHFETDRLSHSNSFLLKVRNHLHLAARRTEDRLLLSHQKNVSQSLGYEDSLGGSAMDRFMRDLYLHLNRVRYGTEEFLTKTLDIIDPLPRSLTAELPDPDFQVLKGNIVLREGVLSEKDPLIILRAFDEANQRDLFLGSGFIWEAKKIIARLGEGFADLPEAKRLFLKIMLRPRNPKIIRLALEIGLVTRFVPEFKRIRNLAEPGFYHVETVDLHSLNTLDETRRISNGAYDDRWPLLKEVFNDGLAHPQWLSLAALLHDIGKGYRGDHSLKGAELTTRILNRFDLPKATIDSVSFLVKHHLMLPRISQHRDLNDEKTAVQVAQAVQTKETLKMLFLLAAADSFATGPSARTDWKIMLLTELYLKARRILERGVLATPDAFRKIEDSKRKLLRALTPHFPEKEIFRLMDQVSSRYFLLMQSEDMVRHFRLALSLGANRFSWELEKLSSAEVTRVILCTYDRPGLFAQMVGVFTLHNVQVLAAHIFTLKNGLAFDVYEVTNPPDPFRQDEQWESISKDVGLAMENQIQLDDRIQKKRESAFPSAVPGIFSARTVEIDNEISDFFTIIQVRSGYRLGILYQLAKEIFRVGLNIRFARFSRDEERMTGDFYVTDTLGQKVVEPDRISPIKAGLLHSLPTPLL
jgi:[protein-PII] uridylyltransferase